MSKDFLMFPNWDRDHSNDLKVTWFLCVAGTTSHLLASYWCLEHVWLLLMTDEHSAQQTRNFKASVSHSKYLSFTRTLIQLLLIDWLITSCCITMSVFMSILIFFLYQLNRCCVQYVFLCRAKHLSLNYSSARRA